MSIDYNHAVYTKSPEMVVQAQELGLEVNCWTVNTPELINHMLDLGVDYITTDSATAGDADDRRGRALN